MRAHFTYLAFALAASLPLAAQSVLLTGGITAGQVLQRGAQGTATAPLTGTAASAEGARIQARVIAAGDRAVQPWRELAAVRQGQWSGSLAGMPAGGPYTLEIRLAGAASPPVTVRGFYVGDLWVLAGQSNMEGVGNLTDVQPADPLVRSFDMSDQWRVAEEPLHEWRSGVDAVHWPADQGRLTGDAAEKYRRERRKGAGLGLPFAVALAKRTGVPIGLVPCAHGGTSMDQWSPALRDEGGKSLYGAMIRRIRAVGGTVRGVLWYQGESDANPDRAPAFRQKFEALVAALRRDTSQPDLPFYYVQIGRHVATVNQPSWNVVQEEQRLAESSIPRARMVAAIDSSLDDGIHVGTADLKRLGGNFALLACKDLGVASCQSVQPGPRPQTMERDGARLRVVFTGVNGRLQSEGRLSGFTLLDEKGEPLPLVYRAEVEPGRIDAVLLHLGGTVPQGTRLRYGHGKDPYCNLRDEAGFGAPAFGPLPVPEASPPGTR